MELTPSANRNNACTWVMEISGIPTVLGERKTTNR